MTIGEKIRKLRKKNNLTQAQLGALAELSTGAIQQYELHKRLPGIQQLWKIAKAMGITMSELVEDVECE